MKHWVFGLVLASAPAWAEPEFRNVLVIPGDATDPTVRSGTPYGVLQGLRGWGVDVVPLDVRPGAKVERYAAAALAPLHRGGGAGRPAR